MNNSVKYWIEAARPRTLPVSVAGVLTAWALNISSCTFRAVPAVLCLIFAILCQVASNFANEYYDYRAARDRRGRSGPRRGVTEGDISPRAMKRAIYITLAAAAAVGLTLTWWGGLWLIAVGAIIGVGALAYSAGPWPLSTHCLGEVAVIVFFGLVPVTFTYYVQALEVTADVVLSGLAIGLMGANVLIVNNYRDIPDDRAVGKHTLATTFGPRAMIGLYGINALAATWLMWPVLRALSPFAACIGICYCAAALLLDYNLARRSGPALNPYLGLTAITMAVFALVILLFSIISTHLQ